MLLSPTEADGIGEDKGNLLVRRRHVARLKLAGSTNQEIADELGIDLFTVGNDARRLKKQWRATALRTTGKLIREQLGRIDALEQEYWDAWEASRKPTTKKSRKSKGAKVEGHDMFVGAEEITEQLDTTTTAGDPRFLQGVANCIEQRRKLLGLDAPEKTESTIKIDSDDKEL